MSRFLLIVALFFSACGNESSSQSKIDGAVDGSLSDASVLDASTTSSDAQEETACAESAIFFLNRVGSFKDLFRILPDGTELTNLSNTENIHEFSFEVSTDGSLIAFQQNITGDDLFVMPSEGGNAEAIGDFAVEGWAPDSSFILVRKINFGDEGSDLWRIAPNGTEAVRLTDSFEIYDGLGSVSANSDRIIFVRNRLGTSEGKLILMNADGSNETEIGDGVSANWHPFNNDQYLYRSLEEPFDIFGGDTNSVVHINLTNSPLDSEFGAKWSPDGTKIVYTSGNSIFVSNSDGSDKKKVFPIEGQQYTSGGFHSWSPDSRKMALSVSDGDIRIAVLDLDDLSLTPIVFLAGGSFIQWRCIDSTAQTP